MNGEVKVQYVLQVILTGIHIAVGGGGGGGGGAEGRSLPHSVQNVENSGKYVYLGKNSVYLGTPLAKNRRSFSEDLSFFLFFF